MNRKKLYIWRLARFLRQYNMTMSGEELADHLNRNGFLTEYGEEYQGKRGTYRLVGSTWEWVNNELGLEEEARFIAEAIVLPDGTHPWN